LVCFSIDDPDVNVVDMDDGIEREDNNSNRQSTNETTSTTDHRYVIYIQHDLFPKEVFILF
jgi:hypothetical protein